MATVAYVYFNNSSSSHFYILEHKGNQSKYFNP